jgi:cyclophilin family peptidyl-prolyl cis-trans isomerase
MFFLLPNLNVEAQNKKKPDIKEAPDTFTVEFTTTKGSFQVEAYRNWSPQAVDRFYFLLNNGFYDSTALFRVQKDYVVQFGIADHPEENEYWENDPLPDEPVLASNKKGTIAYAREGKNSRTTQLFINYKDNPKLDTTLFNGLRGFPPFAKVVDGMEVIHSFYGEYGFEPATKQDSIYERGNSYLRNHYPNLDYILNTKIIGK